MMSSRESSVEWFRNARLGIFIHWGIYSILGRGEWVMHNEKMSIQEYEKLANRFNPVGFNADEWVSVFKEAGAKYMTFTTKHHDGFCMYDSRLTDYKVTRTPFRRDVLRELVEAAGRAGLKVFFYYSLLDWHHPDYYPLGVTGQYAGRKPGGNWEKYLDYYIGQVRELCENYEAGGFWFDGWWDKPDADWRLTDLYGTIRSLRPSALIGNNHHVDPFPGEDFQIFEQDVPGENTAGFNKAKVSKLPLETCMTINNSWGYNKDDKNYKSSEELIGVLKKANGLGANLLLNVGPLPSGELDPEQVKRLREVGAWVRKNYGF
ncbi:MAG: alpha-L-fucosidase [Candidatus Brockarchaeota archaeon]|nr:alpha-L-fucosidase [Candidatus Brockarchaeota archaeon]